MKYIGYIVLVLSFVCLFANIVFFQSKKDNDSISIIKALPYTVIVFYSFLFLETEILSLFQGIDEKSIFIVWCAFLFANCLCIFFLRKKISLVLNKLRNLNKTAIICIVIFAIFLLIVGILAYRTVPYNWDSMTYHLPRVVHWAQNRSISHFATGYYMQVQAPVFAEYIQLNVYEISGKNDSFLNMMQYSSYVLGFIMVYLICRKMNIQKKWSLFAGGLFLTMPISFAESMTTQNDLVTCLFLLCFVYFSFEMLSVPSTIVSEKKYPVRLVFLGASVGLSCMTKYYVLFAIVPMAVLVLIMFAILRSQH